MHNMSSSLAKKLTTIERLLLASNATDMSALSTVRLSSMTTLKDDIIPDFLLHRRLLHNFFARTFGVAHKRRWKR